MAVIVETRCFYEPGADVTAFASAAVTAKRFVKIAATRDATIGENIKVTPCTAAAQAIGVCMISAAINTTTRIRLVGSGGVYGIEVGTGGVTAGQEVESDATGKCVTLTAGKSLGIALNTAIAGAIAQIAIK